MTPTPIAAEFDASVLPLLVCPRHRHSLTQQGPSLICARGDSYAIIEGIPVLLLSEATQTHVEGTRSLEVASQGSATTLPQFNIAPGEIDPFVQRAIGATNGALYQHLIGRMTEYPIPELRLPQGNGKRFLEIGCSWGRWCIAAARKGYCPVGIDPSLKGIRAARRIAQQLGIEAHYVVADGRHLPFADDAFEQVFSYSVLQHIGPEDVAKTLHEIRRVLAPGGGSLVQMPNAFGIRCLYHQMRRRFREATDFEVRYWRPAQLEAAFGTIGKTRISVDGFFSLNAQVSDLRFLPRHYQAIVQTSELLRKTSERIKTLRYLADSLYVSSAKEPRQRLSAAPPPCDKHGNEVPVPAPATVPHAFAS